MNPNFTPAAQLINAALESMVNPNVEVMQYGWLPGQPEEWLDDIKSGEYTLSYRFHNNVAYPVLVKKENTHEC